MFKRNFLAGQSLLTSAYHSPSVYYAHSSNIKLQSNKIIDFFVNAECGGDKQKQDMLSRRNKHWQR